MSGHSKWSKIKWQKASTDAKKGKIYSKMARIITVAVKEKGSDPETNPKLRLAIEKAHKVNMPKENIERAIKKGSGQEEGASLEEFTYEAYGPEGAALIIEGITDNKNRALGEIKNILSRHQGKLANPGSVTYLFNRVGVLEFEISDANQKESLELAAIEAGAQDIKSSPFPALPLKEGEGATGLLVYTKPENLDKIKQSLEKSGFSAVSFSLDWQPQNPLEITDKKTQEKLDALFEALDEQEDINEIYSNLKE